MTICLANLQLILAQSLLRSSVIISDIHCYRQRIISLTKCHCTNFQVEYYNEYLKTCLANLHGGNGGAEDRGKRVRFHKIRGGRGRTSASSLASSRGEIQA